MKKKLRRKRFGKSAEDDSLDEEVTDMLGSRVCLKWGEYQRGTCSNQNGVYHYHPKINIMQSLQNHKEEIGGRDG